MRTILSLLVLATLVISVVPGVFANNVGGDLTPNINTEKFEPLVWLCDSRAVYDDATEPGRVGGFCELKDEQDTVATHRCSDFTSLQSCAQHDYCTWNPEGKLVERINNYAFEGESLHWLALVMDKNGIDKVSDVHVTVGSSQGSGNDVEANCQRLGGVPHVQGLEYYPDDGSHHDMIPRSCNARIQEEQIKEFDELTMAFYDCTLTVETSASMYGEYWATVEATDLDGQMGTMDENEFWFFNPVIALSIDGTMTFDNVRPGTASYSDTLLVGNDADPSSGVMMDMFISGTDFYDSASSGAKCPNSNVLELPNFRYFATNGAYSTYNDAEVDLVNGDRNCDAEGYCNIEYGNAFNNPTPFYDNAEILQAQHVGPYWVANLLAPGSEMAVTFKLSLPEPCNGDFDTGSIFFWGEAI